VSKISIVNFFIYPIKSTFRIQLVESEIDFFGLKHDRNFAIINSSNKIITARENKNLYKIKTEIEKGNLIFNTDKQGKIELSLLKNYEEEQKEVIIFKDQVSAKIINHKINDWISNIIGEPAQLIKIDEDKMRKMKPKYNGKENDFIRFQDASAIHLITESSIKSLNEKVEKPVTIHHFRPNIVIKGTKPYEEDDWKKVKIGTCEFEVAVKTARCPMITINPETIEKDAHQEPLKTLAKLRKEKNKANFGIYLIPRKIGIINIDDEVIIE